MSEITLRDGSVITNVLWREDNVNFTFPTSVACLMYTLKAIYKYKALNVLT